MMAMATIYRPKRGWRPLAGWLVLAVCLGLLGGPPARADGTPAGTVITNTATVTYTLGNDDTRHTASAAHTFRVLEVIDLSVVWQDNGAVTAASPEQGRVLTFFLTNTGNGPETFRISAAASPDGNFEPEVQAIWLETNGTGGLQTTGDTPDTLYQPGINDPELPAGGAILVYVQCNIPEGLNDADSGRVRLSVAAATGGAAGAEPGTVLPEAGDGGVDAVVGLTRAMGDAEGAYQVSTLAVQLIKSIAQIVDPHGGDRPYSGAQVTYRIVVEVTGSGTAAELLVTDPVPDHMTYLSGSMVLDGTGQSDDFDPASDPSDFNVTHPNAVTVKLGDTLAPATHVIEFTTTIN